jgi:hypothetical protein
MVSWKTELLFGGKGISNSGISEHSSSGLKL